MQLHRAPEWLLPSAILCLVHHTRPEFCWKWRRVLQRTAFSNASTRFIPRASPSCAWNRAGVLQGKKPSTLACDLIPLNWGASSQGAKKEICKDKLSFDNPWLGHCHTGKKFYSKEAFTTSRNKKLRHQSLSHWHLQKIQQLVWNLQMHHAAFVRK